MKDFYKDLGVDKDATKDEIKKAHRKLAKKHHPDKGGDEKQFQRIQLAYEVLYDDEKRGKYDRGEPVFDTSDPEAFIRMRVVNMFEQQIKNPKLQPKHEDIFKPMIQQCEALIENAPQSKENLEKALEKVLEVKERIEGENTELYMNILNKNIEELEKLIAGIPKEIELVREIIKYIKKTKYRVDERDDELSHPQFSFKLRTNNSFFT